MTIAVLPAGYFEGVDRRLSNCGNLLIAHGMILAPIVGRVSMNITTIDVTNINGVRVGSEIIVVSDDQKDPNSIINMAKLAGTIPYEIACHIPSHLKREII